MFDRPQTGERAILVLAAFGHAVDPLDRQEFMELALSAGAEVLSIQSFTRAQPEARYLIGSGKIEELAQQVTSLDADLLLFDHALTPAQERNIERACRCRVLDRTGLILDIFAQRARSHEGKLQVELAQLRYLSTRLVRGWTHLERQKGGIGLRGPGETQLETDRRLLGQRIKQISARLEKVKTQREQGRQARKKNRIPTAVLVGYTNAGKSTLFNTLTQAQVYQANKLFATLDPTVRRLMLDSEHAVVLADTVGFIRKLPHELIAAFHATLQETREADLLLHVVDVGAENRDQMIEEVNQVLRLIGSNEIPQLMIYNKIDQLDRAPHCGAADESVAGRIWLSAKTGAGIDLLLAWLRRWFGYESTRMELRIPVAEGKLRARLHQLNAVVSEQYNDAGYWHIQAQVPNSEKCQFSKYGLPSSKPVQEADFLARTE